MTLFPNAKPIQGYDSLLEFAWANALTQLKIPFKHHPGHFQLPNGEYYEPDFLLPESNQLLEVKGGHLERIHKPFLASQLTQMPVYILTAPKFIHNSQEVPYADFTSTTHSEVALRPSYGFVHIPTPNDFTQPEGSNPLTFDTHPHLR